MMQQNFIQSNLSILKNTFFIFSGKRKKYLNKTSKLPWIPCNMKKFPNHYQHKTSKIIFIIIKNLIKSSTLTQINS